LPEWTATLRGTASVVDDGDAFERVNGRINRKYDVNGDASVAAFGFKATSASLKPVHLAQVMFSHTLETVRSPEDLFAFAEKPSRTPSSELDPQLKDLFESSQGMTNEQLDNLRQSMRQVLANDNALYASSPRHSAMTSMSDWFVAYRRIGVTPSQFIYTVLDESDSDINQKLTDQLQDHHDAISLLFRPLAKDGEKGNVTVSPWEEPVLGDAFGDGKIADEFVEGFETLSKHLKDSNGDYDLNYARDLRRTIKFGGFLLYVYMANRHNEIRDDGGKDEPVPIVLNYTGNRNNPVADASLESFRVVGSEIQLATRLGVKHVLDLQGYKDYSEEDVLRELEEDSEAVAAEERLLLGEVLVVVYSGVGGHDPRFLCKRHDLVLLREGELHEVPRPCLDRIVELLGDDQVGSAVVRRPIPTGIDRGRLVNPPVTSHTPHAPS
jgi:hypothetical protein